MDDEIAALAEQIRKNVADGKRRCKEIKQRLDEREVIIKALESVGIKVEPGKPRMSERALNLFRWVRRIK